jgi:DNA-binding GntR family transcriptional regulator
MQSEDERLYEALIAAIVDQRLLPGTRLGEVEVADTYGSTRRHVERALLRLQCDGLVVRRRNSGAAVASPSAGQARDLFQLRRMVETAMAREVARHATRAALVPLRVNLKAEAEARARGQVREAVKLSGEFHLLLAQATGNSEAAAIVRRMVVQTSLVTRLFGNADALACWHDDHGALIELLLAGDGEGAAGLMHRHLAHVEAALRLPPARQYRGLRGALVQSAAGAISETRPLSPAGR